MPWERQNRIPDGVKIFQKSLTQLPKGLWGVEIEPEQCHVRVSRLGYFQEVLFF